MSVYYMNVQHTKALLLKLSKMACEKRISFTISKSTDNYFMEFQSYFGKGNMQFTQHYDGIKDFIIENISKDIKFCLLSINFTPKESKNSFSGDLDFRANFEDKNLVFDNDVVKIFKDYSSLIDSYLHLNRKQITDYIVLEDDKEVINKVYDENRYSIEGTDINDIRRLDKEVKQINNSINRITIVIILAITAMIIFSILK